MKAKKISTLTLFRVAIFATAMLSLVAVVSAVLPRWAHLSIVAVMSLVITWALLRLMDEVQQLERSIYRAREGLRREEGILQGRIV